MRHHAVLPALALIVCAAPAFAQSVQVTNPWARATPPGASTGAVYMTLTSSAPDKLISVATPAAARAEVHEMKMDGDIMKMRAIEGGLPLPANQAVTLAPGSYHLMLMGLSAPLKKGGAVHLHITFEHAQPIDVDAPIGAIGASASPSAR